MHIVVTGASKGFGKAIAEKFAGDKQGHSVYMCSRNIETLETTGKDLQARFPRSNIYTRTCDVSNRSSLKTFAEFVLARTDKIDVLVNNAGIFIQGSVHSEEEGVLEKLIQTNLYSAYHLTRLLLPAMMEHRSGYIFNICSIAALKAYPNGGAYSISKYALAGFTANLREEMKPHGIRVTAVHPGAAYTDSWAESGIEPKRIMEAKDIAEMIYCAVHLSPQACVEEMILRPQLGDL